MDNIYAGGKQCVRGCPLFKVSIISEVPLYIQYREICM